MKVLHIVAGTLTGGAARGAYWLHRGQREIGIDSKILTDSQDNLEDPSVVSIARTPTRKLKLTLLRRLATLSLAPYPKRKPWLFHTGWEGEDVAKHPSYRDADLIHLHWINGLASIRQLRKIKKPVVWTLRDMWPLTGGCHYALGCDRYESGCGNCPQLASNSPWDLSRLVAANKRASLPANLRPIGISQWLSDCAARSRIFSGIPIDTISNNVDTREFFPVPPLLARQVLGIPTNARVILVAAQRLDLFYKGFELFFEALRSLRTADVHVLSFGEAGSAPADAFGVAHIHLGFLTDTISLRLAYSAADVFVAPSRMEAFGKTLTEAMACGTPVACFDATGPKDIVEHQVSGYKAVPFDPADLAQGIRWILTLSAAARDEIRRRARDRVETSFDSRIVAKQYRTLYAHMLDNRTSTAPITTIR